MPQATLTVYQALTAQDITTSCFTRGGEVTSRITSYATRCISTVLRTADGGTGWKAAQLGSVCHSQNQGSSSCTLARQMTLLSGAVTARDISPKKDLDQDPRHLVECKLISCQQGKGGEEALAVSSVATGLELAGICLLPI